MKNPPLRNGRTATQRPRQEKASDRERIMRAAKNARVPAFVVADDFTTIFANPMAEAIYGPVESGSDYCSVMFREHGDCTAKTERTCLVGTMVKYRIPRLSVINQNVTLAGHRYVLMDGYRVASESLIVIVHTDVTDIVEPFIEKKKYEPVDVETMVLENKFFLADDRLYTELRRHC